MWEASLGKLEMGAKRAYNIIIFVHRTIGKPNTAYFLSKNKMDNWIRTWFNENKQIIKLICSSHLKILFLNLKLFKNTWTKNFFHPM